MTLGHVSSEPEGPSGYSYAAVLVRVTHDPDAAEVARAILRDMRFSGWVARPEHGWLAVVPDGVGTVAAGRRGVVGVGEALAHASGAATLAFRVLEDRQLVVVAWDAGREVLRYVSDPSREPFAAIDVVDDPIGVEGAEALAEVCGHPDVGQELTELLAAPLDHTEQIESERLGRLLRLLQLPGWLVTAWRLPRSMVSGPPRRDLLRMRRGRTGPVGWTVDHFMGVGRRWRRPPAVLLDPPRSGSGDEDPSMWL
jgi:hypothetical protein